MQSIKSKIYSCSNEEFISIIKNNYTYSDCLREIGLSIKGTNSRKLIKKRISELKIDISHFDPYYYTTKISKKKRYTQEEIQKVLSKDSIIYNSTLRRIIMNNNLLEEKCAICGISNIWNDKKLTLQIDHINGDHNDNRLENLRFLCPNCHSQTETYSGKNNTHKKKKKYKYCKHCQNKFELKDSNQIYCSLKCASKSKRLVERPDYKTFQSEFEKLKHNYSAMSRKYGVSDNAIRKWEKAYQKERNNNF